MNLTTLAKVKSHLGIRASNTTKDAILNQIITGVSGFVEQITNRKFGIQTYTERIDGDDSDEIFLKQYPVVDLISLEIDDEAIGVDAEEEDETLIVDNEIGSIWRDLGFAEGRKNIKVVYTAGYNPPVDTDESSDGSDEDSGAESFPNSLEGAVIRMVARVYERRTAEGVSSVSPGSFSVQYKDFIDDDIQQIIDSHKKRRVS
ncbi:MAG TPA: phage head-tail connector protein [Candidatus Colwellbacteria bacterium]|nr:phage head-tail connector protein [Candidatus Colwellbacteria bacterium]